MNEEQFLNSTLGMWNRWCSEDKAFIGLWKLLLDLYVGDGIEGWANESATV